MRPLTANDSRAKLASRTPATSGCSPFPRMSPRPHGIHYIQRQLRVTATSSVHDFHCFLTQTLSFQQVKSMLPHVADGILYQNNTFHHVASGVSYNFCHLQHVTDGKSYKKQPLQHVANANFYKNHGLQHVADGKFYKNNGLQHATNGIICNVGHLLHIAKRIPTRVMALR
jgi:hypothetical protein